MRMPVNILFVTALLITLSHPVDAAVVQIGHYGLGEDGTVGNAVDRYSPLNDNIGTNNEIANVNGSGTPSIITSGLAAPGSTAALSKTGGMYWFNGSSSTSFNYGLTNNFAIDLWVQPNATAGTYLGTSANDSSQGLVFWATNTSASGTSLGGNTFSAGNNMLLIKIGTGSIGFLGAGTSTYTSGAWYRITVVDLNNTLYYYLDGALQDTAAVSANSIKLNDVRLGSGPGGSSGGDAAYDEMSIWQFDGSDSLASITSAIFPTVTVPTPSALPAGLALLAIVSIHRRRA